MTGHDLDRAQVLADQCERAGGYCGKGLLAEVKSLRAKLAAVQEWAMVNEIAAPPLDWAALGRALAAAEQDEPKREQS